MRKVKDTQVEVIINKLCANMVSDDEKLRDISSVGMCLYESYLCFSCIFVFATCTLCVCCVCVLCVSCCMCLVLHVHVRFVCLPFHVCLSTCGFVCTVCFVHVYAWVAQATTYMYVQCTYVFV